MRSLIFAATALIASSGLAFAQDPTGTWKTAVKEDGRYLHVEITACQDDPQAYCGTIAGAFGGASEANIGKPIIWDMKPDGENAWADGRIWAPDEDETYKSKMELNGDVLKVSGCVLAGLICRGQDWTRP